MKPVDQRTNQSFDPSVPGAWQRLGPVGKAIFIFVNIWLVFHLLVVIILPNTNAVSARRLDPITVSYANFFVINTSWEFFSPGPAPQMYLDYEVEMIDATGESHFISHRWPEDERAHFSFPNYRRLMYFMRFCILDGTRLSKTLAPFFCRQHPGARRVSIQHTWFEPPHIESVLTNQGLKDQIKEKSGSRYEYDCATAAFASE